MENSLLKTKDEQSLGGLYFSVTIFLMLVASIIFSVIISLIGETSKLEGTLWYALISFSLSGIVITVSTLLFSKANGVNPIKLCGFKKTDAKYYLLAVATSVAMFFGLSSVNFKFIEFLQNFGYEYNAPVLPEFSPFNFIAVVFATCILPAIAEEVALRGIVQNGIKTGSVVANACIGGFLFAIYHMNPAQTPYQFIIGFVFSLIAIKSRSVLPTVIAHFLNNFATILIEYFYPSFALFEGAFVVILTILSLVCLLAIILLLIFDKSDEESKQKGGVGRFFANATGGIAVCLLMWIAGLLV